MLLKFSFIVFLLITLALFWIVPKSLRKYVLLIGSIVFVYLEGGTAGLVVLAVITLLTWLVGFFATNGIVAAVGIGALALILFGWKYLPVMIPPAEGGMSFAMPIGLSFYTFQAISYIADIYMGRLTWPEKNPLKFALYMMWFPKWMSGPIERCESFMEQIDNTEKVKLFSMESADRFVEASGYLIWGLFMKLVIADRIGAVVDSAFADIAGCGFLTLMLASVLYTLQIYCDFAGYTNSMIGISKLFGIELTQNFVTPYLAESTVEFWRRWHISLSNFLRDYIYIPLGGNRKGAARKRINTLVVFFVCGMWHGAGLSFIVWGLLHGLFNILSELVSKSKAAFLAKGISGRIVTFCLVSFAWIFFRAANLGEALTFIGGMVPGTADLTPLAGMVVNEEMMMMGISVMEWWIAGISIVVLAAMDICAYRKKSIPPVMIYNSWGTVPRAAFLVIIAFVVLVFGKYGSGEDIRSFMYMAF